MADQAHHLSQARKWFKELQTSYVSTTAADVERYLGNIRNDLTSAHVTFGALDETGRKSDFTMEQELKALGPAAHLRCARHLLKELETTTVKHDVTTADYYIDCIRKHLAAGGLGLPMIDPAGRETDAEIEERFKAGKRRISLQKARGDFADFEKSTCEGWGPLSESILGRMVDNVTLAGKTIAALDPDGKSSDADIQKRMTAAARRLKLMYAQAQLKEAETTDHCYSIYGVFTYRKNIEKELGSIGLGLEAADVNGKSTAAQVEHRLTLHEKRLCQLGALHVVGKLEKLIDGTEKAYAGSYSRGLAELDEFLVHVNNANAADPPFGKENQARMDTAVTAASFKAVAEELENFEKMGAPRNLSEIDDRNAHIAKLFNRASDLFAAAATPDENAADKVRERLDEASTRARELYYAAGGKPPVMKRIKLVHPAGEPA